MQQFHRNQMADRQNHKEAEIREEVKFNKDNVHLLQVRERLFCAGRGQGFLLTLRCHIG